MKKKTFGVIFFLSVLLAVMGFCACGRGESPEKEMGRYVEEASGIPEGIYTMKDISAVKVLKDGTGACIVANADIYTTPDNGNTWEKKGSLDSAMAGGAEFEPLYAPSMDSDGKVFFIYNRYLETEEERGIRYSNVAEMWFYDSEAGTYTELEHDVTDLMASGMKKKYSKDQKWQQAYDIAKNMGATTDTLEDFRKKNESVDIGPELFLSFGQQANPYEDYVKGSYLTENMIFLLTKDGEILQIDRTTGEKLHSYSVNNAENGLWLVAGAQLYVREALEFRIFDITTGTEKNNEEVRFLTENGRQASFYGMACSFDEKKLYFATSQGLYEHEAGGSDYKALMEGTMSSLCMTEKHFCSLMACGDGSFQMFIRNQGTPAGIRFAYHEEIPRYPDKEIKIYSLEKIFGLDKTIAQFQAQNPDIYVTYTWGKSGDDAMTTSDALKVLNTKILAKEGPDVMFLDNMPIETYISNGMLADLSDLVKRETEEGAVFKGMAKGIHKEGATYAVPLLFNIPMMIGKEHEIGDIKTAEQLYEFVDKMASDEKETAMITDIHAEKEMLATMFISNGSMLFRDDGTLDVKELEKFLDLCKKLYDLAQAHLSYSIVKEDEEDLEFLLELGLLDVAAMVEATASAADSVHAILDHVSEIYFDKIHFSMGVLDHMQDLVNLATALGSDGDFVYQAIPGNSQNCYIGKRFIGVNSLSRQKESAEKFVSYMMSEEGQNGLIGSFVNLDFSVNKKLFDAQLRDTVSGELQGRATNENQGAMILENEDGTVERAEMVTPGEEFYSGLSAFVDTLSEPMYNDTEVYDTIVNMGVDCLKGNASVEETAEKIVDKMDLFLSE